jgi:putative transposase
MMVEKFKDKYRISSARLAEWDYGSNAAYFVTICSATRSHDFGEIVGDEMVVTALGQAAIDCWNSIPGHFPFVVLDEFVVMPNHIHGIVIINKSDKTVETQDLASLQPGNPQNRFGPQSLNLASIVRGYKIGVTKFARQNGIPFLWQTRYHDHIIRNGQEYETICRYIHDNPQRWAQDGFYNPKIS